MKKLLFLSLFIYGSLACDKEKLFLNGYIKHAQDIIFTDCDPYDKQRNHSCAVFATDSGLRIYDASDEELVLGPTGYFPLRINSGNFNKLSTIISPYETRKSFIAFDEVDLNLFIIDTKGTDSFKLKKPLKLLNIPSSVAAFSLDQDFIKILITYKNQYLDIITVDKRTGQESPSTPKINRDLGVGLDTRLSHIKIDEKASMAIISNEGQDSIQVLSLPNFIVQPSINIGFHSKKLFVATQDNQLYALAFNASDKEVALINISTNSLVATKKMSNFLQAAYFPSGNFTSCNGHKNWFLVTDVNSKLSYFSFDTRGTINSIKELDMADKNNMATKSLVISEIAGGYVKNNFSKTCKRQVFIATSSAHDYHTNKETEAQGNMCEADTSLVIRLGPESLTDKK